MASEQMVEKAKARFTVTEQSELSFTVEFDGEFLEEFPEREGANGFVDEWSQRMADFAEKELSARERDSAKNWNALLFDISKLYALIDEEWADADIGNMEEFDPWQALRELTPRFASQSQEIERLKGELVDLRMLRDAYLKEREMMKHWKNVCASEVFQELKHGQYRGILYLLSDGQISVGKAAEAIAEWAHSGIEPRLPEYESADKRDDSVSWMDRAEAAEKQVETLTAERDGRDETIAKLEKKNESSWSNIRLVGETLSSAGCGKRSDNTVMGMLSEIIAERDSLRAQLEEAGISVPADLREKNLI